MRLPELESCRSFRAEESIIESLRNSDLVCIGGGLEASDRLASSSSALGALVTFGNPANL